MEQDYAGARTKILCRYIVDKHEEKNVRIDIERLTMVLFFYQALLSEADIESFSMGIKNVTGLIVSMVALDACETNRLTTPIKGEDFCGAIKKISFRQDVHDCLISAIGLSLRSETEDLVKWVWSTCPLFDGCGFFDFYEWKSRNRMSDLDVWLQKEGVV